MPEAMGSPSVQGTTTTDAEPRFRYAPYGERKQAHIAKYISLMTTLPTSREDLLALRLALILRHNQYVLANRAAARALMMLQMGANNRLEIEENSTERVFGDTNSLCFDLDRMTVLPLDPPPGTLPKYFTAVLANSSRFEELL